MEEEPAERVTTHHRSVGKEGLRRRGWRDEGGVRYWVLLREGIMSMPILPSELYPSSVFLTVFAAANWLYWLFWCFILDLDLFLIA